MLAAGVRIATTGVSNKVPIDRGFAGPRLAFARGWGLQHHIEASALQHYARVRARQSGPDRASAILEFLALLVAC